MFLNNIIIYILNDLNFFTLYLQNNNSNLYIGAQLFLYITNFALISFFLSFIFKKYINYIAIIITLIQLFLFYYLKLIFKLNFLFPINIQYLIFENLPYKPNINYGLYLNNLTYNFIIICIILTLICLLLCLNIKNLNLIRLILIINFFSINTFLVDNFLLFFFFLEGSVIPMILIILGYGSRLSKFKASYTYFYISLIASSLLFIGICIINYYYNSINVIDLYTKNYFLNDLNILNFKLNYSLITFFLIFIGLSIKIPMFPFHIWLPEAHGEANTVGSVLLAGVYLKMAFFGLFKFIIPLFYSQIYYTNIFFITICFIAIFWCSIIILNIIDLKKFIAYTSIIHMNFGLIAFFSLNSLALFMTYYSLIIHSYVTSTLFILIGFIYDRIHTRNLNFFKNFDILKHCSIISIIFFIILLINASVPIGPTFLVEFNILLSIGIVYPLLSFLLLICLIINSIAHFLIINKIIGNKNFIQSIILNNFIKINKINFSTTLIELVILSILISFIVKLIFNPNLFISISNEIINFINFNNINNDQLKELIKIELDIILKNSKKASLFNNYLTDAQMGYDKLNYLYHIRYYFEENYDLLFNKDAYWSRNELINFYMNIQNIHRILLNLEVDNTLSYYFLNKTYVAIDYCYTSNNFYKVILITKDNYINSNFTPEINIYYSWIKFKIYFAINYVKTIIF